MVREIRIYLEGGGAGKDTKAAVRVGMSQFLRELVAVDKAVLYAALAAATRNTAKREYHKIHHGPKLLARLDPAKVRRAARHCDRLFSILRQEMTP